MPDDNLPGGDFEGCMDEMQAQGYDEAAAERVCGALQEERKAEHGNVEELKNALKEGAGLIADVGVDLVSGVDEPAVDSKWVMLKSDDDGHDWQVNAPILLDKAADTEQRISYAPAMIPREPDKEGDVVATPTVEKAAHNFLTKGGGVDTDHSLIDGEGDVVESWVLKEERTFSLPGDGGEEETYPAGTWMTGIKWGADAWERIQAGELTGLSIYGMADHVQLARSTATDKAKEGTSDISESAESDKQESHMTDTDTDSLDKRVDEMEDTVSEVLETVESIKDVVESSEETDKDGNLIRDFAAEYAEKEDDVDVAAVQEAVRDALSDLNKEEDEDEEDEEDEMEASEGDTESQGEETEKDANLSKGSDGRETAAKAHETDAGDGGMPSYKAAAQEVENK